MIEYDIKQYWSAERDLCKLHKVSEDEVLIETELDRIHGLFGDAYPLLKKQDDYEFPDWHHHIRIFWAYLYSDAFYNDEFIPTIQRILASASRSWFAEFECYSPTLKSPELPSGDVGTFLLYKDSLIFQESDHWATYKAKLGV